MNRKPIILAVLLMISVGNFSRLTGNENIRLIQFISIFVIGMLTALLFQEIMKIIKK